MSAPWTGSSCQVKFKDTYSRSHQSLQLRCTDSQPRTPDPTDGGPGVERPIHVPFKRVPTTWGGPSYLGWLGPGSPNGPGGVVKIHCKNKGKRNSSLGPADGSSAGPRNASAGPGL